MTFNVESTSNDVSEANPEQTVKEDLNEKPETVSVKKGAKSGKAKDIDDPSSAQLSAMLDEMVMLSAMGIDVVLPAAPELPEISDDEDTTDDADVETKKLIDALSTSGRPTRGSSSGNSGVSSRSMLKSARDRDRDRQKRRDEKTAVRI